MKYKDVKDGQIFYFVGSPSYPKLKLNMGHKDIRDQRKGNGRGLEDLDVYLSVTQIYRQSPEEVI